jgi:hypothetical protein
MELCGLEYEEVESVPWSGLGSTDDRNFSIIIFSRKNPAIRAELLAGKNSAYPFAPSHY